MPTEKLFNIHDAHNAMSNLNPGQALKWAQLANKEYQRLKKMRSGSEREIQRRAIEKASQDVKRKYAQS